MHERIIGRHSGAQPGPLLVCIGGIHGNERAGVLAIEEVFRLLRIEPDLNPGFAFKGTILGVIGNLSAWKTKSRFIDRDLNRMLDADEIEGIRNSPPENRNAEDAECLMLVDTIHDEIKKLDPPLTLVLDLHTTTADGGLFTIANDDPLSLEIAKGMHVPVILGVAENLPGTTLRFFQRPEQGMHCVAFEAGQHDDPECVHRAVAAVVNCMRRLGMVEPHDVDHRHDGLLIRISTGLPKVTRLIHHYLIKPGEEFVMKPGYRNFEVVREGDALAQNEHGPITSPANGLILMPKYQPQGDDGFFLIEPVE